MNIDTITKELYEYIVSKPYGTEVGTSSCLCGLYNLEHRHIDQQGWILTNGDIKLSSKDLFDIDSKLDKMISDSGVYFIDSTQYLGACVGLPYNAGGILRTYDGVVDEFRRRKTRDYGGYYVKGPVKGGWHYNRYIVRIPPKSQMGYPGFGKFDRFYYLITHGTGVCMNKIVTAGDNDTFGAHWNDLPEVWCIQNLSEEDMYIYFTTTY